MFILQLIAVFTILLGLLIPNEGKVCNLFMCLSFVVLVLLRTFVDIHSVPDLLGYCSGFNELKMIDFTNVPTAYLYTLKTPEIGFRYLMKISSCLSDNFELCLLIIAVLSLMPYFKTIKQYSTSIALSVVILYLTIFTQSIFVLRQHLAMGILLLSYQHIISRNFKGFMLIFVLAFLMHQTALIFFPTYFVYGLFMSNNRRFITLLLASTILASTIFPILFGFFLNNLTGYDHYVDADNSAITSLIISGVVLATYIFFCRDKVFHCGIHRLLFVLMSLDFILLLAGWKFGGMPRLLMYFSNCMFLLIPLIRDNITYSSLRKAFILFIILIYYYMTFMSSGASFIEDYSLLV